MQVFRSLAYRRSALTICSLPGPQSRWSHFGCFTEEKLQMRKRFAGAVSQVGPLPQVVSLEFGARGPLHSSSTSHGVIPCGFRAEWVVRSPGGAHSIQECGGLEGCWCARFLGSPCVPAGRGAGPDRWVWGAPVTISRESFHGFSYPKSTRVVPFQGGCSFSWAWGMGLPSMSLECHPHTDLLGFLLKFPQR